MVWCNDRNLLFVHIPKCGRSSIENKLNLQQPKHGFRILKPKKDIVKAMHHYTLSEYQNFFDKNKFNNFNKFTIVRHPYNKFISEYYYFKRKKKGVLKDTSLEDFLIYTENLHSQHFNNIEYNLYNDHFFSQSHFLKIDGKIHNLHIFKLEEFYKIKEFINVNYPNDKKWKHLDKNAIKKKEELNEDQKKRVYKLYYEDFQNFNYQQ